MKKRSVNNMDLTFSLRRKEIVEAEPLVSEVRERWPALFTEEQASIICAEFYRITTVDLMHTFHVSLEKHSAQLIRLYRARCGAFGDNMQSLLDKLDEQTSDIVAHRKRTALKGLPLFLREKPGNLLKTYLDTDPEERYTKGVKVGIITVVEDDVASSNSLPTVTSVAIVLEEVFEDVCDLPTAFALLFCLLYALNIDFPKELKYTFDVIQQVLMDLGSQCSARVQSLKTKLLL
ncbi:hypothetical protein AOXY_G5105 [Acipenser oxyrinchus oxyrinchus]|uniref:Uncharacterized protein n=1 Tax=Acipenser oxyrinchus oxyrinchus TaxID=40147 RepID=A0AAD8GE09_ACIOX|nr:hypothetical protein AOXY_G5105 [Acipenser oxyrinchus oxyrinchus]